jgi:hypothetical protein
MKVSVEIKEDKTGIVLSCENAFEKSVIEKLIEGKYEVKKCVALTEYQWQCHVNHRIEMSIELNSKKS